MLENIYIYIVNTPKKGGAIKEVAKGFVISQVNTIYMYI